MNHALPRVFLQEAGYDYRRKSGMKTKIMELCDFGQSVWLDNISRNLIDSGKLYELICLGLRGVTSNPSIFEKAISAGLDYNKKIEELYGLGRTAFEIYDALTISDVQDAADIFLGVYKETKGLDGYISLEINPKLAYNAEETIKEGMRLFKLVNKPNLMVKVPATEAGFMAIEELTSRGISINATLIFSVEQYAGAAWAYIRGLRRFLKTGASCKGLRSVASVFVSRIDSLIDKELSDLAEREKDDKNKTVMFSSMGKAAVINSALIYKKSQEIFSSSEFRVLWDRGANIQRVLWASTSTKNPAYSDIKYVTELIAKNTVNTMPNDTLCAFLDHGKTKAALPLSDSNIHEIIEGFKRLGIDMGAVCVKLQKDGICAFEKSFDSLLKTIEDKKKEFCLNN